jgi:tRNA 2-thiouridine synthesizing protein A
MDQQDSNCRNLSSAKCRIKSGRGEIMGEIKVDVRGETCPVPLVEMRKAVKKAAPGDIIEIVGTHPASKKEIPMAAKALTIKILSEEQTGDAWKIVLQK